MTESIGMMEGAFFVPRTEILSWLNGLLKLSLEKIEQTASGAVACQIMDCVFPGTVPMGRVNWNARNDYEFVNNYKILQQVFIKHNIQKVIEVEKLVKGKYQDNLEFMQWLKRFFDMHANSTAAYDPVARRKCGAVAPKPKKPMMVMPSAKKAFMAKENRMANGGAPDEVLQELTKVKEANKTLTKERDFYFGKLRDLELVLNAHKEGKSPLLECIGKILYATQDDKIMIDEKGNLRVDNPMESQVEMMQE